MFKKFTWGHGIVLALGGFMIFILSMIFIFTRGWTNSELVSDDYYQEELQYQDIIDAKNNANQLPELPQYSESKDGIVITFPKEIRVDDSKVHFHLFRTDDGNLDVEKEASLTNDGRLIIPSKVLFAGPYTLKINWKAGDKNYQVDYDVLWK